MPINWDKIEQNKDRIDIDRLTDAVKRDISKELDEEADDYIRTLLQFFGKMDGKDYLGKLKDSGQIEEADEFDEGLKAESSEHYDTLKGNVNEIAGIVRDHLKEDPDYYAKLKGMEREDESLRRSNPAKLKKGWPVYGVSPTAPLADEDDEKQQLNLTRETSSNAPPPFADPSSHGYQFITGDDYKEEPQTEDKKRVPLLSHPDYYPGILKEVRKTLDLAWEVTSPDDPINEAMISLGEAIDTGAVLDWHGEVSDYQVGGFFMAKTIDQIAGSALNRGDGKIYNDSKILAARISKTYPINPEETEYYAQQLSALARSLDIECEDSSINKSKVDKEDSFILVSNIRQSIEDAVLNLTTRNSVDPTVLAAMDALYEDANTVLDGLRIGRGATSAGGAEDEILEEAEATNTYADVEKTDALLDAVEKKGVDEEDHSVVLMGKRDVNYRMGEDDKACSDCIFFAGTGQSCLKVEGPIYPDMVCDLFKSGSSQESKGDTIPLPVESEDEESLEEKGGPENIPDEFRMRTIEAKEDKAVNEPAREKIGLLTPTYPDKDERNDIESSKGFDERHYVDSGDKAESNPHPGCMIAWFPDSGQARQLRQDGGESADQLHVTILWWKEYEAEKHRKDLVAALKSVVLPQPPMQGSISGIGRFNPDPDSQMKGTPIVALVDVPGLSEFRAKLLSELKNRGYEVPQNHGFTPHMTLKYDKPGMDDLGKRGIPAVETTPISIDRVFLVEGDKRTEFSLDRGVSQVSGKEPDEVVKAGDEDVRSYAEMFGRMFRRGYPDSHYRLAVIKDDGNILEIE